MFKNILKKSIFASKIFQVIIATLFAVNIILIGFVKILIPDPTLHFLPVIYDISMGGVILLITGFVIIYQLFIGSVAQALFIIGFLCLIGMPLYITGGLLKPFNIEWPIAGILHMGGTIFIVMALYLNPNQKGADEE